MKRTGFPRLLTLALLGIVGTMLVVGPGEAQHLRLGEQDLEGEPTDPDRALFLLEGHDLEDYGLAATAPEEEGAADSWFQALLDLLHALGILTGDSD